MFNDYIIHYIEGFSFYTQDWMITNPLFMSYSKLKSSLGKETAAVYSKANPCKSPL